jgi:hypothetical protein
MDGMTMESLIADIKEWASDPVVAALLGFFITSVILSVVRYFVRASRKE